MSKTIKIRFISKLEIHLNIQALTFRLVQRLGWRLLLTDRQSTANWVDMSCDGNETMTIIDEHALNIPTDNFSGHIECFAKLRKLWSKTSLEDRFRFLKLVV